MIPPPSGFLGTYARIIAFRHFWVHLKDDSLVPVVLHDTFTDPSSRYYLVVFLVFSYRYQGFVMPIFFPPHRRVFLFSPMSSCHFVSHARVFAIILSSPLLTLTKQQFKLVTGCRWSSLSTPESRGVGSMADHTDSGNGRIKQIVVSPPPTHLHIKMYTNGLVISFRLGQQKKKKDGGVILS